MAVACKRYSSVRRSWTSSKLALALALVMCAQSCCHLGQRPRRKWWGLAGDDSRAAVHPDRYLTSSGLGLDAVGEEVRQVSQYVTHGPAAHVTQIYYQWGACGPAMAADVWPRAERALGFHGQLQIRSQVRDPAFFPTSIPVLVAVRTGGGGFWVLLAPCYITWLQPSKALWQASL